jgi:hypothetical protein
MDPTRFDTLTRSLTRGAKASPTRRAVLATLAAALAAVGGGHLPATETAAKKKCKKKSGKLKCDGVCIDPQTDFNNCGTCGNVCGQGQTCNGGTCVGGGGDCDGVDCPANTLCENGNCVAAPNRCAGPTGICNADPTPCGTAATGETCGCESTVEGNNFCANAGDNVCTGVECTSTQDCEDTVGFHFFCQEAKTNAQGQFCGCGFGTATGKVCVPECDNPNVAFAQQARNGKRARGKQRR